MQYRDSFLRSVVVIDTETTNMYPDKAEIVELAAARYDGNNWDVISRLFGAADGIPPEASAKNHISRHMIEGLPTFIDAVDPAKSMLGVNQAKMWVAHNSDYDQTVLDRAFTAAGDHGSATLMHMRDMWICTYRLSQQLLDMFGVITTCRGTLGCLGDCRLQGLAHFKGHDPAEFLFVSFENLRGSR